MLWLGFSTRKSYYIRRNCRNYCRTIYGEPGTQLTMRTFHTGGIFTGEILKQINAPFSGKILIPDSLKTIVYRTNHGNLILNYNKK